MLAERLGNRKFCMVNLFFLLSALLLIAGCSAPRTYDLMPTPVMYVDSSIDPFAHLPDQLKDPRTTIFYATNRAPASPDSEQAYTNGITPTLRFGRATVRMGEPDTDWQTLHISSLSPEGRPPISISLEQLKEDTVLPPADTRTDTRTPGQLDRFFGHINDELATVASKEIMVYVHGTKVDFNNAAILTSEVEHFAGRDLVSFAYAWPSHQNILSYVTGTDVKRAQDSSSGLADVLTLLALHSDADEINILSYSAGCRVASKALDELRGRQANESPAELRKRFRIGTVIFAAADVEVDVFLDRLEAVSELADQIVVTVSDKDNALIAARRYMGGPARAGMSEAEERERSFLANQALDNVSIVDVSRGQQDRGFDITGHHYWYRHPWMSSDIIFAMRTNLPPARRGLQTTETGSIWYLSTDYPQRVQDAVRTEIGSQW